MSTGPVQSAALMLPSTVMTKTDVSRLLNEVESIDNDYRTAAVRSRVGVTASQPSTVSEQLSDFMAANRVTAIGDDGQRRWLLAALRQLKHSLPTVHVTFASAADRQSLQRIVEWLRGSIHPHAVIMVGLQPSLVGGVYIRTSNRVFDFSIRKQLAGQRGTLVKELEALVGTR